LRLSSFFKFLIAFLLGLISVFVIEPLDRSTVSTPLCLGIVLMALSLRQSTYLVAAVGLTYIALTIYALIQFQHYYSAHFQAPPHPYFWLFQRSALFVVLCGMSIYLAHYRTDTGQILSRFRAILGKLPVPVLLSDATGNIVYVNDALTSILHQSPSEITGKSFFNFFTRTKMKGEFIRFYFELFEAETNGTYELEVHPFGAANKINAQMTCLGSGPNRVLITVLENNEKMIVQPSLL
jgi:PAS domain-containing protein